MKKVVVIGGGTGNFTVLSGLKEYAEISLSAIVSMADDGGSTGVLRDDLGVLPPGDVRQCLVALSDSSMLLRSLMNYRFEEGGLGGHSFGNLLLSALEKVTGSFERAVEEVGHILSIKGEVIPVTMNETRLKMLLNDRTLLEGEGQIYLSGEISKGYSALYLEPYPAANPHAIKAIKEADMLVIGPGGLYTSLIPNLLIDDVRDAILNSKAHLVLIANLMNKKGQTEGFTVQSYVEELSKYFGKDRFDSIIVNNQKPRKDLLQLYESDGSLVECEGGDKRIRYANLLGEIAKKKKGDPLQRNLIRHNSSKLAEELMSIVAHL